MISKKTSYHNNASIFEEASLAFSAYAQKKVSLELFKKFKKNQEQQLQRWHTSGGSGREIARQRSELIDILVKKLFELSGVPTLKKSQGNGLCVVALGGYGRCELNPFSDIDILFLHEEKKITPSMEQTIGSILMTLWDLGFKVGHATRSIKEAVEHANKEMLSKTAMLECRVLVGEKGTFKKFKEQFQKKCILGHEKKYVEWRLKDLQRLHEKFGKTVFMQEPNIKSGKGGLREYQNLLWVSSFHAKATRLSRLVELKFLRESERVKLEKNYDFLLRVRTEMHYQEGRASDQLTLLLQGKVATALGYPQRNIIRRSEAFMKDYYEQTREIHLITSLVLDRMKLMKKRPGLLETLFPISRRVERLDGFLIKKGFIFPENREVFKKDPARMMRIFSLAQERSLNFSPELSDLIKRRLLLIDSAFQHDKEICNTFLNILSRKGEVGRILRLMHDLGFLGKYIPEFGALTCLVQHEFYHRFTADEHTLVCIEKIDELLLTENKKLARYSTLFKNLDDPTILYLGMLLHDTGRAANVSRHAEASTEAAKKVAQRFQLTGDRLQLLLTLVEAHGELATVARTRDLDDFITVSDFAKVVPTLPILQSLMILTLADGMGTSDSQWSDWKEQLVWNLYDQTKKYLEMGELFFEKNRFDRISLEQEVRVNLGDDFSEEIRAHFEQMPERYVRMMEPLLIQEHLQLFRSFFQHIGTKKENALNPVIQWREHPELGHTEVWICGWDRKRLLEKIAASFLIAGINILSADIFTRRDQLTLDIFRVTSVRSDPLLNEKEKRVMEQRLKEFLRNTEMIAFKKPEALSLSQRKSVNTGIDIPPRISIDDQSHPIYTLVEVETPDRQGLFYDLLEAFHTEEISIDLARIATEMKVAHDTFYVLGATRKKINDPHRVEQLQLRLLTAVSSSGCL